MANYLDVAGDSLLLLYSSSELSEEEEAFLTSSALDLDSTHCWHPGGHPTLQNEIRL